MADQVAPYETFEGFLQSAIKAYWESPGRSRTNFLSLLLATRKAWQVAWDEATEPATGKKILTGAAGAAAIAVLVRVFLGGPIGILLTGASVASLVAIYAKNHKRIWAQAERYRGLVETYRRRFAEVRDEYVDGKLRREQRDLMIDGLMRRFLTDLEAPPAGFDDADVDERDAEDGESGERLSGSFARHAARRRAEEERDEEKNES